MPAVSVATCEALKEMLAGAELSQEFDCERSYANWNLELDSEDDGHLRVDVCLVTTKQLVERNARGGTNQPKLAYTVPVDVAVRKKLGQEHQDDDTGRPALEEIDDLVLFVQELHTFLLQKRLDRHPAAIWKEDPQVLVCPLIKHLREHGQFTAVIRLTYRNTP